MNELFLRSDRLPGGNLISALFDRTVMSLADKGAASNLVGERWADLASSYASNWPLAERTIPGADGDPVKVVRVDRLDNLPRIAAVASRRGLQNPDLLIVGEEAGDVVVQAADAKFSVETARSKQVSAEMLSDLMSIRPVVPELLSGIDAHVRPEPGIFLCPDYSLTRLMLNRGYRTGRGILRTTVSADEVELVPVSPETFWEPMEGQELIELLQQVDHLGKLSAQSLAVGLYYFRLSRAAAGLWHEATRPILSPPGKMPSDMGSLAQEAVRRTPGAGSAFELIQQWDEDVQEIRNQRAAIEHVANPPIPGKELRDRVARIAHRSGAVPPSVNQVRRRLGAWYRHEVRQRIGVLQPPIPDLNSALAQVAAAGKAVAPQLDRELERIVLECLQANSDAADLDVDEQRGRHL